MIGLKGGRGVACGLEEKDRGGGSGIYIGAITRKCRMQFRTCNEVFNPSLSRFLQSWTFHSLEQCAAESKIMRCSISLCC